MKTMNIAIIGQGRSGRDIHGAFFKSEANDFCRVVCVVEEDEQRRERAALEFGCDVLSDYRELYSRDDIDVVVNASYSQMHYEINRDLLLHGFNVLSEKPLARTYYESMDLVRIAKEKGVTLAAFHQTLLNPAFLKVKEIIASGKLGRVCQINLKYSGFSRRWDWQTLQSCCAGSIYNSGPHPIGQALDLLDWDENVRVAYSSLDTVLTFGDSDDFSKIILKAPGKPTVDIEVISADAYAGDFVIKVFGSKGTLLGTNTSYKMKYIDDFSKYPDREVKKTFISTEGGLPAYCSEKLEFTEEHEDDMGSSFDSAVCAFYKMLYNTVMCGEPLAITPEQIAMVVSVIETCHAENPLPVKFS
ncbi:MAG: Gfo/Idh/MocA family oxidoreductase [Clostridia bacterium]|nr:Gfo/Idh/MocA family oxidoreductase [Clostridia bacterium]